MWIRFTGTEAKLFDKVAAPEDVVEEDPKKKISKKERKALQLVKAKKDQVAVLDINDW